MTDHGVAAGGETPNGATAARRWSFPVRFAFRFFVVYFGIYILSTQMLWSLIVVPPLSEVNLPELGAMGPLLWMVEWTATNVFGVTHPLVVKGSGSGDKTFDWVQAFCFLVIAAAVAVVWSVVGRRENYVTLHKWFRLFLRFSLGSTLVMYGAGKAIPLQMPYPGLTRLVEPFGHFSPMGVLWTSIGVSPAYEVFTGCAELVAGILLFIPRTATLGALLSLGCAIQIFTLNMTYDVPVKLFSFHLVLMSLFLLAPDAGRLLNMFLLDRPAGRSPVPPLGKSAWAIRSGVILQVVLAMYIVGMNFKNLDDTFTLYGGDAAKSPLYGIWDVAYLSEDGVERLPLVRDNDRWRRVVFDWPTQAAFQRMDDTFARFNAKIDMEGKWLKITKKDDPHWSAIFWIMQPAPNRLTLDGEIDGKNVQLRLELFPHDKLLLVSRGFNWIQEYPFNR